MPENEKDARQSLRRAQACRVFCAVYRMDNFLSRAVISVAIAWGSMQAETGCKAKELAFFETEGRKTFKKSIIFAD